MNMWLFLSIISLGVCPLMTKDQIIAWVAEAGTRLNHPTELDLYRTSIFELLGTYALPCNIESKMRDMLAREEYDGYATDFVTIVFVVAISNINRELLRVPYPFIEDTFKELLSKFITQHQLLEIFDS